MEITERRTADIVTLSLSGKLDTTTANAFEQKILVARIECGDRRFIIGLAQLDYISSSGLRVLASAAKRLANDNGKIVLCSLNDPVKHFSPPMVSSPVSEKLSSYSNASPLEPVHPQRRGRDERRSGHIALQPFS